MGFWKTASALIVGVCVGQLVSVWRDRIVQRRLEPRRDAAGWRHIFRGGTRL
jgi:hypothetical protein